MRAPLLFLISLGLGVAAPVARDYEKEAREFFGQTLNLLKTEKYGEAFDLVAKQGEGLMPGLLEEKTIKKMRAAFVAKPSSVFASGEMGVEDMDFILQGAKYLMEKEGMMTKEANKFFGDTLKHMFGGKGNPKFREYSVDAAENRKKFDALTTETKVSLIKAYPLFGRLDEIQAYIKVADAIVRNIKGLCTELPGFKECDELLKLQ